VGIPARELEASLRLAATLGFMAQQKIEVRPHHLPRGGFRNPWASGQKHGLLDFLKWSLVERRRNPRRPDPEPDAFIRVAPEYIVPRAAPDHLTLTWIGHTSFLIQIGGLNVLTDPIWSDRASPVQIAGPRRRVPPAVDFDRLPPIDAVLVSHDHYDHLDSTTVSRLSARFPAVAWYAPLGVAEFLRRHRASAISENDWWDENTFADVRVTCVPAQHFSGRTIGRRNSTLWCGWTLRSGSHSVFFAGDTALHPEFRTIAEQCGPFDLAILPIGAYDPRWFMASVHMDPNDCIEALSQLEAPYPGRRLAMAAAHWGTFKLTDEPMSEPPRRIRDLWGETGRNFDDLWVMQQGETRSLG
jgi:N-acyl-phosphatidylethanolamine-hydrolysing phospholipase D